MKNYKISHTSYQYGNFTAILRCCNCNQIIIKKGIPFSEYHIGVADTKAIEDIMVDRLVKDNINYCCGCGKLLKDSDV